ncbi:hypothetical protein [Butyrivibrio sp. LC3010]|uniref:hypothetical protein n=1 Tax=Butyrivibrio sp. LC3010 TaxID=1280680 RepID=UPI0004032C83|nr:hypothetical protein [Butyrivibrio sp. LC3010]
MRKRIVVLNCVLCAVLLSACSFEEKNSQQSSDSSSKYYTYSEDESSDDQLTSSENVPNTDKSENDIKEDNVRVTETSWEEGYAIQNEKDSTKSDFFWIKSEGEKIPITKEEREEYAQNYVEQADLRYIEGTQDNVVHISDLWDE